MLELQRLVTLRAVLAHGSFSAAAQALHLTQPAVSRQVSQLERRLGTQLVHRSQRGVRPTEAGVLLVEHTEALLDRLERAETEVRQLVGLERGTVRLGSFYTALVYLSGELGMILAERHPGLAIVDDLVDRREALAKLLRGALDVAIVFERDFEPAPVPAGVATFRLFDDPVRVLLPAGHPLAGRAAVPLRELAGETWIRAHDGSAARHVDQLLSALPESPRVLLAGHGDEPVEAQALVAAGRGITVAYDLNVLVGVDQIAVRPLTGVRSVRHVRAAHLRGRPGPAVAATLDALRELGRRRRHRLNP
jgi:DNA-binding transcriptional LysR family regulator